MRIQRLELKHYRGFSDLSVDFPENGPAVFTGWNGAGKTSVLEALTTLNKLLCNYQFSSAATQGHDLSKMDVSLGATACQIAADVVLANGKTGQLRLNYLNMLGVCRGGEGGPAHPMHCDKSRKNAAMTVDPRKPQCEDPVKFTTSGTVFSEDERVETDLNQTLNLNIRSLKSGRTAAIQAAKSTLKNHSKGAIQQQLKKLEQRGAEGKNEVYCQAAIYMLRKKLHQL
ncbi:MAG: AAA family ATPase [Phaeodactylibacter sp.]|uniref:AAA family ATPase n=1 Tax=Phaeodactylibacter sp. TaxID=1940289 RepID=UPI0032EAA421